MAVRTVGAAAGQAIYVAERQQLRDVAEARSAQLISADPSAAFGWTSGRLVYPNEPIAVVAADLSRQFGKLIKPADDAAARLRFTGVLVVDSEENMLRRLQWLAPLVAKPEHGGIVLRLRADRGAREN